MKGKARVFSLLFILASLVLPGIGQTEGASRSGSMIRLHDGWTYRSLEGGYWGEAVIPGAIHVDLQRNHQLPDPYSRDEASRLGWVDTTTWIYSRVITEHMAIRHSQSVDLVFEGLDTYARVYINNKLVLEANNMFRSWSIPLDQWAQTDTLRVDVIFSSAVLEGQSGSTRFPWTYPADSDPYPGKPSVFTRKAACQFGWDFAPPMPGCGIWKPVYLHVRSDLELSDGWLQTMHIRDDTAMVMVRAVLHSGHRQSIRLKVRCGEHLLVQDKQISPGQHDLAFPFRIDDPRLWWPAHEGKADLYSIRIEVEGEGNQVSLHWLGGIRTIELHQAPDSMGTPFSFVVNGRPVFAAGANWVPADMFPGRVSESTYQQLLLDAHEAGFNMMRVWGGGIYEQDIFYHLADSLGLMIWQDFMFANTMYPADPEFMENVSQEAREQIIRLRKHPSLALWCGNNEIDVAWKNWGWPTTYGWSMEAMEQMEHDYDLLFKQLLPSLVVKHSPPTPYVHTSPLSNWGDPADLAHGDNHFWGVWHGEMPFDSLQTRIPRFMSEYGMQSFPVWESIKQFSQPEDWRPNSPVMQFRQRSYKGNGLIERYRIMEGLPDPGSDFRKWVETSHALQAKAYEMALTTHIEARPFCMGSLLWQFNEPWPGASWSIIDYYGRKKPAYFSVRKVIENHMGRQ